MKLSTLLTDTRRATVTEVTGDTAGRGVELPTIISVLGSMDLLRLAITGQVAPPPATGWSMSNNRLAVRVTALEVRDAAEADRLHTVTAGVLEAVAARFDMQAAAFQALLDAQAARFTAQVEQARADVHADILGSVGPALDAINQLRALAASDEAADADIHAQLLTAVRADLTTAGTVQASTAGLVATLQTSSADHGQQLVTLQAAATGLRTDLTAQATRLGTVTTTADGLTTAVGNLTTTVNGHTGELSKRLRNDQNDGTAYNLTAKKATAAGQVVVYEQLPQTRAVSISSPAMAIGAAVTVTVTWPVAFADNSYGVSVTPTTAALLGLSGGATTKTATGCIITLKNTLGLALLAGQGTLDIIATHY